MEPVVPSVPRSRYLQTRMILFALLGILFVILILLLFFIWKDRKPQAINLNAQQVATDTTTWPLYKSASFRVKYPPSYTPTTEGTNITITTPVIFKSQYGDEIRIAAFEKKGTPEAQDLLGTGPLLTYKKDALTGKAIQQITVGGFEGALIDQVAAGPYGSANDLIVIGPERAYEIVAIPTTAANDKVFDLMVATFQTTRTSIEEMKCNEKTALEPKKSCPPGYTCELTTNATDKRGICKKT